MSICRIPPERMNEHQRVLFIIYELFEAKRELEEARALLRSFQMKGEVAGIARAAQKIKAVDAIIGRIGRLNDVRSQNPSIN